MASMKMIQDTRKPDTGQGMARAVLAWIAALTLSWGWPVSPAGAQTLPCGYTISDVIQAAPGPFGLPSPTSGVAISPNGRWVCGDFNPGGIGYRRGFWFDTLTHQFHVLPVPAGAFQSWCSDVNDSGWMVGTYVISGTDPPERGFVFDVNAQSYIAELLPLPGGAWCDARGINSSNMVSGFRSTGPSGAYPRTAFRWTQATGFQDLGLINGLATGASDIAPDGEVAAYVEGEPNARIWTGQVLIDLGPIPGGADSAARDIASNGHLVGFGHLTPTGVDAYPFDYRNGRMDLLPTLGPQYPLGVAEAVNDSGFIVGLVRGSGGNAQRRACLWVGATVANINNLFEPSSGLILTEASAINDLGTVVCAATSASGALVSAVLQPIPRLDGDTNCDDLVNVNDLLSVIMTWGETSGGVILTMMELLM